MDKYSLQSDHELKPAALCGKIIKGIMLFTESHDGACASSMTCSIRKSQKITLHHLLIMGCGHETEIMDNSENWISTFLHHPVLHEPGTFYKYNTAGTNMLAAVLRKKTGQNVTEFLKSRLLEPLGITSLTCALLGDGTELGGGGMKMVTEDMAKFTYFLSRQGEWEGKQLLRKDWFERACRMIVRFQEEKLLLEAEDTLISVGGLGISPRQALTAFEVKES